jgi:hypothetical protein
MDRRTPSGANGNFGVGGGIRSGAFWGHLNYVDHDTGMHVQGTGVTAYTIIDDATRRIEGSCLIDGVDAGYSYVAVVRDLDEPGWNDTFCLTLSTGYAASGDLGGPNRTGGGNIQLHKNCPGPPPGADACNGGRGGEA